MHLEGKVAIVTGASRGIGRAVAINLAQSGADVVVNYSGSEGAAQETVEAVQALGRKAIKIKANVAELVIQPSCSLLHVPVTTKNETELEETLLNGLAFADQKLVELNLLASKLDGKEDAAYQKHVEDFNKLQNADFRNLELESSENVRSTRPSDYKVRREVQNKKYNLHQISCISFSYLIAFANLSGWKPDQVAVSVTTNGKDIFSTLYFSFKAICFSMLSVKSS